MVESLCLHYGDSLDGDRAGRTAPPPVTPDAPARADVPAPYVLPGASAPHAFPTPEQLAEASLEELQALKLGYRAKYIHRLCQDAVSGRLDLHRLASLDYAGAMEYLTGFYGIGKKVANCVCLFGLHHIGAFPVDTWIEKILMEQYYDKRKYRRTPKTRLNDTIVQDVFGRYEGCAGIMQQYIFHFERNVLNGKH